MTRIPSSTGQSSAPQPSDKSPASSVPKSSAKASSTQARVPRNDQRAVRRRTNEVDVSTPQNAGAEGSSSSDETTSSDGQGEGDSDSTLPHDAETAAAEGQHGDAVRSEAVGKPTDAKWKSSAALNSGTIAETSGPADEEMSLGASVIRQAQQNLRLQGPLARQKPPDTWSALRDAHDEGFFYREDAETDGHTEDQDDPRLAEAVEECIRICFGLRGILRIGPGRNELSEPIIVVTAAPGLTDVSVAAIPPTVHGFATLVAIPFELLPLKREG